MTDYAALVKAGREALATIRLRQPKRYHHGAAVLTNKGTVYAAANYYSDTATLTLHAEQAALAHAAAHGEREILAVACVSIEAGTCHPCGICKQLMWESSRDSGIDIDVVMAGRNGRFIVKKISELVPYPWPAHPRTKS